MTPHRFAFILIGLSTAASTAFAADDGETKRAVAASQASPRTLATASSLVVGDSTVVATGEAWRVRRLENPLGTLVLVRNETAAPLSVSLAGEETLLPQRSVIEKRCRGDHYPIVIAAERGEVVLVAQAQCGDSVVVLSDRAPRSLEPINEAPPSGESVAHPFDRSGRH